MDKEKTKLLNEIEKLISYGDKRVEISQDLLKYLDIETLKNMLNSLKTKTSSLKEEDKEWLKKFKREE